jgi:TRAP-type C4-dicarboxylate transport system permease small subunit
MTRLVDSFFQLMKIAIVVALALMVILVFGNVVLRYGFNKGITVSEELSRMLFVWLSFGSAVIAMHEHGHLGMDTIVGKLPPLGKKMCLVLSQGLMFYATCLFLEGSWKQTLISINVGAIAPVTGMSMGWFYGTGVLFSLFAGMILMGDLYQVLTGKLKDNELVMVKESEELSNLDELQKNVVNQTASAQGTLTPKNPHSGRGAKS